MQFIHPVRELSPALEIIQLSLDELVLSCVSTITSALLSFALLSSESDGQLGQEVCNVISPLPFLHCKAFYIDSAHSVDQCP